MKIVFFGDSITDMGRSCNGDGSVYLGNGYVFYVAGDIKIEDPSVEIINRGVSGERTVDLYARIKRDVWNLKPDVLSILVGVNDVGMDIDVQNGVEYDRFVKVYSMIIEDTLKVLPDVKIVLCEPFMKKCLPDDKDYNKAMEIKKYAKAIKGLSEKYGVDFIPLQDAIYQATEKGDSKDYLYDGIHLNIAGARLVANEWMKYYNAKIKEK